MIRRTRRAVALATSLLVGGGLLVGCGLPEDSEPRPIAQQDLPQALGGPELASPQAVNETGVAEPIYLVAAPASDDEEPRLAAFDDVVFERPLSPETMVDRLLVQTPVSDESLSNFIPQGVELVSYQLSADGTTATLTLTNNIADVESDVQRVAFAQIVWTVTETGEVSAVRFKLDDDPDDGEGGFDIDVIGSDGEAKRVVTRDDYLDIQPEL
jgi:hypothetical protein